MDGSAVVRIRFRDFLFPRRLLSESGADDNPLMVYSERRARRPGRRVAAFLFGIALLVLGYLTIRHMSLAYSLFNSLIESDRTGLPGEVFHLTRPISSIDLHARTRLSGPALRVHTLIAQWNIWFFLVLTLLLLRYHLFVNDQSRHTKNLSKEGLENLLQTHLGRDEFFLHHFLLFCLRYRTLAAFTLLAGFDIARSILSMNVWWVIPKAWAYLIFCLNLVLLAWVGGAAQYVLEWRWFAGGRRGGVRLLATYLLSALIAGAIVLLALIPYWTIQRDSPGHLLAGLALTAGFFLLYAWLVHRAGQESYEKAMELIWRRFTDDDPDLPPTLCRTYPGAFDLLSPWSLSVERRMAVSAPSFSLRLLDTEAWRVANVALLPLLILMGLFTADFFHRAGHYANISWMQLLPMIPPTVIAALAALFVLHVSKLNRSRDVSLASLFRRSVRLAGFAALVSATIMTLIYLMPGMIYVGISMLATTAPQPILPSAVSLLAGFAFELPLDFLRNYIGFLALWTAFSALGMWRIASSGHRAGRLISLPILRSLSYALLGFAWFHWGMIPGRYFEVMLRPTLGMQQFVGAPVLWAVYHLLPITLNLAVLCSAHGWLVRSLKRLQSESP